MARRPRNDRLESGDDHDQEVAQIRGGTLTLALKRGVPGERHALIFLRDLVQREGYDYKALVKHVFLEGVRVYEASLAGSHVSDIAPIPMVQTLPPRRDKDNTIPVRQRVQPKRETAPPTTPAHDPEPLPAEPPMTEILRPNFAGLMADSA